MKAISNGLAERLALWRLPGTQRLSLLIVLAVDLVLLGLFLRWAYVEHHHIAGPLLGHLRYSMIDGSYSETFGYMKQAAIVALLLAIWRGRGGTIHLGFALLFLATLLDDSLALHEHMARWAATLLRLRDASQDKGEIAAFALLGIVPALVVLYGYLRATPDGRRDGEALAFGFGVLFFFAVVADYIHGQVVAATGHYDTALSLFEDGGELLTMTLILGIALRVYQLSSAARPCVASLAPAGAAL